MGIQWTAWGTTVRIETTDPTALPSARRMVARAVADAERAADLDNSAARVNRLVRAAGRPVAVHGRLADLIDVAMDVARASGGVVDPTVGVATHPLRRAQAVRQRALGRCAERSGVLPLCATLPSPRPRPATGWRTLRRAVRRSAFGATATVALPAGGCLDLTATAKARTAELAAAQVADRLGVGVLVEIGGDVATAGPPPSGGWLVTPRHAGGAVVHLTAGDAVASVRAGGIVDPLTGRPVSGPWSAVAVAGTDLVTVKCAAVAALVQGSGARERLERLPVRAWFVPAEPPGVRESRHSFVA
jgi:thiamine biosynthesis lipoprotein